MTSKVSLLLQEDVHLFCALLHLQCVQKHCRFANGIGPEHAPTLAFNGGFVIGCTSIILVHAAFGSPQFTFRKFAFIDKQVHGVVESKPKNALVGFEFRIRQYFVFRDFEGRDRSYGDGVNVKW
jgi:hypothetical protein